MDSKLAINTINKSCYQVGYPTHDAEYERRKLINESCDYAIECIDKVEQIKRILDAASYVENDVTYSYCYDSDTKLKHIREALKMEENKSMDSYIKKEDAEPYLTRYVPGVEAVTLDEITDLYQNMDDDFIERYYPEYTRLTGSYFVIGDQIAQGNLLILLELWKQYRRLNNV